MADEPERLSRAPRRGGDDGGAMILALIVASVLGLVGWSLWDRAMGLFSGASMAQARERQPQLLQQMRGYFYSAAARQQSIAGNPAVAGWSNAAPLVRQPIRWLKPDGTAVIELSGTRYGKDLKPCTKDCLFEVKAELVPDCFPSTAASCITAKARVDIAVAALGLAREEAKLSLTLVRHGPRRAFFGSGEVCGGARVAGKHMVVAGSNFCMMPGTTDQSCDRWGCAYMANAVGDSACPPDTELLRTSDNPSYFLCRVR